MKIAPGARTEALIHAMAEDQHARVARRQLIAGGASPAAIGRRVRSGRLIAVHRGVYGLPNTGDVPLAAETAALLACGEGALLSHHSAATLWALRPGTARPVHVTIPEGRTGPSPTGVVVHRSRTISERDVRVHEGLPITSPARTMLDVAATLPDRDVERLLDEGVFARRLVTRAQIDDVLERAGNHPGRARLTRVAGAHTRGAKTDSPPEERLLALIRAAGLPEPRLQVHVLDYRLDFFWPRHRLAVEVDAYGTHGAPMRFEADRKRDAKLLTERGISVLRLTRLAIEQRPFETVAVVARAIGRREAELLTAG